MAFSLFDKDRDGTIDAKELGPLMRTLGKFPTEKELQALVELVDFDGDGSLDFAEFLLLMGKGMNNAGTEEELINAFLAFEEDPEDPNGMIDSKKIYEMMELFTEKEDKR